jgi:hypothetical protein
MWNGAKAREEVTDRAFCLVIRFTLLVFFPVLSFLQTNHNYFEL